MDYYAGGDLRKLLKKKKKLPENVAKFYLCEIVLALEALHKAKIIYRDLKPENVLLCADGHCLLIDFNLATQNKERSNSVCGTYNYLAPEMLERSGHSFSMDWYMLGVIMYELLEGTTPYYNPDRQTLYSNIRGGCLMIPKHLKEETKGLLRALLCRTPANRLGFHGSASVKAHPFFANVNWDLVYQKKISAPITTTCEIDKTPISPDFLNQNHK
jgi:protein-serine/threonine kinase